MANSKNKYPSPISLLYLPTAEDEERQCELYFWYDGNPFGLEKKRDAIVAMDGQIQPTQAVEDQALEVARSMYEISPAIGYLVARRNFLVVNAQAPDWNRISQGVLEHFPEHRSIVRLVDDKKGKIASAKPIKRMNLVREAEGRYASRRLPNVVLHIPEKPAKKPF